jgi:hypothetical protein
MAGFQDLLKYWDLTRNIPEGREDAALKPEPSELVHWIQEAGLVEPMSRGRSVPRWFGGPGV